MRHPLIVMALGVLAVLGTTTPSHAGQYTQTNIVSDVSGKALLTDPNLKNPWGLAYSRTSPFWVSNQGSLTATLYTDLPTPGIVTPISPVKTQGTNPGDGPTGQVHNGTASDFMIPGPNGTTVKASFLFDTLNGTIQGWNPGSNGGLAKTETITTVSGAVFTGLTIASSNGANYLYAANAAGGIVVFDGTFKNVTGTTFAGKFVDPNPVAGFNPYNIQLVAGHLFVTYAATTSTGAPLPGGYVDEYDTAGNFVRRITSTGVNAPWGLTMAPSGFGQFSNDLLVGNLYDSKIDAYNLSGSTPTFVGSIQVHTGYSSAVGLWALGFGNGKTGGPNTLFFTAGVNNQRDGLFGSISVPEPGSALLLGIGMTALGLSTVARRRLGRHVPPPRAARG